MNQSANAMLTGLPTLLIALFVNLSGCAAPSIINSATQPDPDYQKFADNSDWKDQATINNPLESAGGMRKYTERLVFRPGDVIRLSIEFLYKDNVVYNWEGHYRTVFFVDGDMLYYADYARNGPGGDIVAVDLAKGHEIWRTHLVAVEARGDLSYSNTIGLDPGPVISIWGFEKRGRYLELIRASDGKMLGHHVFKDQG